MCPGPGLVPGVQEVGISSSVPLSGCQGRWHMSCDGLLGRAPGARQTAGCSPVLREGFGPAEPHVFPSHHSPHDQGKVSWSLTRSKL